MALRIIGLLRNHCKTVECNDVQLTLERYAMPLIGLKEASKLTGKNPSTIHRAMKDGRISYTVSETGERVIDPAELDRVFPVTHHDATVRNDAPELASNLMQLAELRIQLEAERAKQALLQDRLADKDGVIADLRTRLDAEGEERRRTQAQLTALLTDQRVKAEAQPQRRWWSFGGNGQKG